MAYWPTTKRRKQKSNGHRAGVVARVGLVTTFLFRKLVIVGIKIHTKTIEVPDDIAKGLDGPAYLKLRTRIKKKYLAILGELATTAADVMALKDDETENNPEVMIKLAAFNRVNDYDALKAYAYIVLDWNWIDEETGKALPKPTNAQAFGELYEEQLIYIQEQIGELRRYSATEGNERNGSNSETSTD